MRQSFDDSGRLPYLLMVTNSTYSYQLRLKPAEMLLLVTPCAVSPMVPEMLTPSESFCSAPTLRSHLSSPDDSVWPAIRLVPVLPMLSLADCSVSKLRLVRGAAPGSGTMPCWVTL